MRNLLGRRSSRILTEREQDFKEQLVRIWIPFRGSRQGPVTGICEPKNKLSVFLSSE